MATKMSKAMYGKTMMKSGGTKKLVKKGMGGPGSGMGRMAADDAAYDSMMATPATTTTPNYNKGITQRTAAIQSQTIPPPAAGMGDKYGMTPYKNKNGGATKTTYKTGGMVNANAKITASKVAKGRPVKSTAPKKALPKAKLGMSMKSKKSC
jgi:hypothetical protein